MNTQMISINLFGTSYELPVIKDSTFESLQLAIKEHREVLSVDDKKKGLFNLFAKKESLSAEERLQRMENLVENYDELIKLLRSKIQACRRVFESIGDGVEEEFLKKLAELEKLEQQRQTLEKNFMAAGHSESVNFEEQRQNIRNMVTNLSRSAILILKKLRYALDALEALASDDEKQRQVYETLKNDVNLYRQFYEFNQKMAAIQKEIAQMTNIALNFDSILRDNLGPLGILVDQIGQIDSNLSESLAEIEKLSLELEKGSTSSESLSLVSDTLISSIISGRMRSDVISDILENLRNPLSDTDQIDFNLRLAESVSDELNFAALADNMRILVRRGIHDLELSPLDSEALASPASSEKPVSSAIPGPEPATLSMKTEGTMTEVSEITQIADTTRESRTSETTQTADKTQETPQGQTWTPPPPRREQKLGRFQERQFYSAAISRANPTLVVFLLDQSGSMETPFTRSLSRSEYLGQVVDRAIEELASRCNKADGIRNYFDIAILGYGNQRLESLLGITAKQPWLPISEVAFAPLKIRTDEQGLPHPQWVPIRHEGDTPMCAALQQACYLVGLWCNTHPASYPPTVINITDGESTDGDPEMAAHILRQLHTQDGQTLFFNLHVGDVPSGRGEIVFPESSVGLDEYGALLFRMSSPMPPHLKEAARAEGFRIFEDARFFAYGAGADLATRFLNLGTRPGKLV